MTKTKEPQGNTPARQLGRVPDEVWKHLKRAAQKEKMSFTVWAVNVLITEANRVLRGSKK